MHIEFTVPGLPIAQPRQRYAIKAGKAMNYTEVKHNVNAYKAAVKLRAAESYDGGALIDGPVSLLVEFFFPRTQAETWKTKPMPRKPHCKKPDADNLLKAVKDSLTGCLWRDDALVWSTQVRKWIIAGDEMPHTYIKVEW